MRTALFILLFFLHTATCGQDLPPITEQQLENLNEENIEDDALLQQLSFFQKHPLNLNTATVEELFLLRFLTGLQIQNLVAYRSAFGAFLSIYELQAVPGFDLLTIKKLLPFVIVSAVQNIRETLATRLRDGSRYFLLRTGRTLERSRGYDRSLRTHYLGSPYHLQARLVYQYKNLLYYGIVADKDAGEPFLQGAQKAGFDFYSAHFFARNLGRLKALALGDYAVNLGQGLIQWQSLAFGKSAEIMQIKRQAPVLLPYRSAGEFYFNRGAAATLQAGAWEVTAFISYKAISGNVVPDSVERFSSFNLSGYHRTALETEDRNRLRHFSTGGSLGYQKSRLKLGANAITHRFSLPLQKQDAPYNHFALSGKTHFLASMDYSYTYNNTHVFGEFATDSRLHAAMVHGAMISLDPKADLSVLYRKIAKEFQSPFGNAFTEATLPGNETGFFTGLQLRPQTGWQLSAYADFYRFPFLRYRVSAPTRGWDYLAQLTYAPDKRTEIYLRYRSETKPLNNSGQQINHPVPQQKQSLRFHYASQVSARTSLRGRTEIAWFKKEDREKENGFLTFIEVAHAPLQRLKGNMRFQYFETDSYDSRIYAFETDVLYGFSIPAFFDKGLRYYLNIQYNVQKQLTLWLRIAQTFYRDKQAIGSGLDRIEKNHKTEIKLQIRYGFR